MKKKFTMENIDCAFCAAKMEEAIKKIDGVNDAGINFLTEKLTLDYDEARFEEIMAAAVKACKKIDKGCRIVL